MRDHSVLSPRSLPSRLPVRGSVARSIGRRELIALAGRAAAAALVAGPLGITVSRPRSARASTLDELRRAIAARDGSVLGPGDLAFQNARRDYNLRFDTVPQA